MTTPDEKHRTYFEKASGWSYRPSMPSDDFLHPEIRQVKHPLVTETQYFGFSIPEENIYALNYLSQRPHMKHLWGGVLVFQGKKRHRLAAEIADYRLFMTDEPLDNDLHNVTLINGYHTEVLEPMRRHRISYRDDKRKNSFDVEFTSIMPAVCWKEMGHLEQAQKAVGELVLRGKRYDINGYHVRNRTWGEIRPEDAVESPPAAWMSCTFDDTFAFNCCAIDDPDLNPVWKSKFAAPQKLVLGGWVYRDGEIVTIKSCRKITHYDALYNPVSFEFLMQDSKDREYDVKGTITASINWDPYFAQNIVVCLAEIECNGRKGVCDFQDMRWTDFHNAMD